MRRFHLTAIIPLLLFGSLAYCVDGPIIQVIAQHDNGKTWKAFQGQLSEDGKPSLGVLTLFNDNGTREEEEEYAGGVIDGHVRQYYPDGSIQAIWEYSKGVREGVAIGWHRTGALEFCWFYRADVLSGRFQSFFSDGKTMSLGAMKEGKKIGDWIDYHDNGVVAMKAIYGPDGSLVGTAQSFDKTGAEIKKKQKNNP